MKRPAQKALVLAVCIVVMLIAGCEEEEENLSNPKKSRLIAAENMRLKKDLQRRDQEIKRQKELLEKYLQEKNAWKEKAQQNLQKGVDSVLAVLLKEVMEKNEELSKENESLNVQIEKLKAELEEAKK